MTWLKAPRVSVSEMKAGGSHSYTVFSPRVPAGSGDRYTIVICFKNTNLDKVFIMVIKKMHVGFFSYLGKV